MLFGGYDGTTWLNDMHEYNFDTKLWSPVAATGRVPSIRSCPSWCKEGNRVYVFGGYDGVRRMNDFFACDVSLCSFISQTGSPSYRVPDLCSHILIAFVPDVLVV